ncbi:unnamed protein product [Brassica rapa subsp. trilocularis]
MERFTSTFSSRNMNSFYPGLIHNINMRKASRFVSKD